MNDFESFHFDLYHAKLKWMSVQSGYTPLLWDETIQNQINAISNLSNENHSIEAHIIAVKSHFGEGVDLTDIIKTISLYLKEQSNDKNKSALLKVRNHCKRMFDISIVLKLGHLQRF